MRPLYSLDNFHHLKIKRASRSTLNNLRINNHVLLPEISKKNSSITILILFQYPVTNSYDYSVGHRARNIKLLDTTYINLLDPLKIIAPHTEAHMVRD